MNPLREALRRGAALAAAVLLALPLGAADEYARDTPAATVETLHTGLVELAERAPDASVAERYRALEPLIEATHDLPYVARFALRREWDALDAADRERYVEAFERLSVMTYAARFGNVGAGSFRTVEAPAPTGERAEVSTAVARANGEEVSLEYLLQREDDGWRIVNIVADGVSDLALKRAEYQRLLAEGSIDTLIAEIEAQTARLEQPN